MIKYSLSNLFNEQMKQKLDPELQDKAIKAVHRLARWIDTMNNYSCNVKVMNLQITIGSKVRLIFKYTSDKDRLVAKKILFS